MEVPRINKNSSTEELYDFVKAMYYKDITEKFGYSDDKAELMAKCYDPMPFTIELIRTALNQNRPHHEPK